jgi:hypothetical protein
LIENGDFFIADAEERYFFEELAMQVRSVPNKITFKNLQNIYLACCISMPLDT